MMQLSSKIITYRSVMTSSLRIKIFKIDKFGDFSCDIDYNSRTEVFRDDISLIINQCEPKRPKGASGGQSVCQPRCATKRSTLVTSNILRQYIFKIIVDVSIPYLTSSICDGIYYINFTIFYLKTR